MSIEITVGSLRMVPAESEARSLDLQPGHLQLCGKILAALRRQGIDTIAQAEAFARSDASRDFQHRAELIAVFVDFAACTSGGRTDWRAYWRRRGNRFEQLCASLPELDGLSDSARRCPVNRATFGNAGAMLERAGYDDLGKLADGLQLGISEVAGLGRGKLQRFFMSLQEVASKIGVIGSDAPVAEHSLRDAVVEVTEQRDALEDLPEFARALPIGILHLGLKTRWLKREGFDTVGDLVDAGPFRLSRISAVGPGTQKALYERMHSLARCTDELGVNWDCYCAATRIHLIPKAVEIRTGEELLALLNSVFTELGQYLEDAADRDILRMRLTQVSREQSTLEEIAARCRPVVTRERIRQKEAKLLDRLAGALLREDGETTNLHFRPSFSVWWRRAASEFADVDDIGFDEFVTRLSRVWNVSVPSLTRELPFILAIMTGEPQMPLEFKSAVRLNPVLYGPLRDEVQGIPLSRLRLRGKFKALTQRGLSTFGDLVSLSRSASLSGEVLDHLNLVGECLDEHGSMAWNSYRRAVTSETIPPESPKDGESFAAVFAATIKAILERVRISKRAVSVFELRTSRPLATRMTLDAVAQLLDTHGPTIKREESILLAELHEIIVERQFSDLSFWLDETWLRFCREAHSSFEACSGDYDRFVSGVCLRWFLTPRQIEAALPSLWAIFSGYPDRRRRDDLDSRELGIVAAAAQPAGRIRLRGFRSVH